MSSPLSATLGTLLRHLIELLDGGVEESYRGLPLEYRPRYTPIVRTLLAHGPVSMRAISEAAGITHSAVSQTVAQMAKVGLVTTGRSGDGRERVVELTPAAEAMVPALRRRWAATEAAARALEAELSMPLSTLAREAIAALEKRPFPERLAAARSPDPTTESMP